MYRIVVFHFHICFAPAVKWGFFVLILFGIFDENLYVMKKLTKESVIAVIKKALDNKRETVKFLKGDITKEQLESKGIKLAKPF